MTELDKRIAEEIMGESMPVGPERDRYGAVTHSLRSVGGGWVVVSHGEEVIWEPLAFSSDWNWCMKALKQCKDMDFELSLDPFLDGDEHFMGYSVEVGIAEGGIVHSEGHSYASSKVEKECNSLDDLPRVLCEAMLEYRGT